MSEETKMSPIERYNATRTQAELLEATRKGGINSGKSRRQIRTFRECLKAILGTEVSDEKLREVLIACGMPPNALSAINFRIIQKAIENGDVEAARFIRDSVGEKPTEALNMRLAPSEPGQIRAMDLSGLSDAELEAIADGIDQREVEERRSQAIEPPETSPLEDDDAILEKTARWTGDE